MTTANKAPTVGRTIFTTPTDRELVATRVFDAPRKKLWDAHTNPRHVSQWMLGPDGHTMPVSDMDLRPGGKWHYQWREPNGSTMDMDGEYQEVKAPERLVATERWGKDWPETINDTVLTEKDGRTTVTVKVLYPSREAREKARQTGMEEGWSQSYDRLDDYLTTMK
jgi:uncharacterized protein YndB with AHSA1/START domain